MISPPSAVTSGVACKICLDPPTADAPLLIRPCLCAGSMGSVHLVCLRQWIEARNETGIADPMVCEICKTRFALRLQSRFKCQLRTETQRQALGESFIRFIILALTCIEAGTLSMHLTALHFTPTQAQIPH
jgi:E3 ubiquitin-protein ligase MARCH3